MRKDCIVLYINLRILSDNIQILILLVHVISHKLYHSTQSKVNNM